MEMPFLRKEWTSLCGRVRRTARHFADGSEEGLAEEVVRFTSQDVPQNYPQLLERTREAARLAQRWRHQMQSQPSSPRRGVR
jgi:hypothetical protein